MGTLEYPKLLSLALCALSGLIWVKKKPRFSHILLLAHTAYIVYQLLIAFPMNVFTDLGVPLNGSAELLRMRMARRRPLDPELEGLFKRLGSLDHRLLYVRFGHDIIAGCDYCQSFGDYALLALPRPLLAYIREMAFVGVLTLPGSPKSHLRPLGLATLMLSALAEAYFILSATISIKPQEEPLITMWHDTFLRARLALFLLLPFLLHLPRIPFIHRIPIISTFLPIPDPRASQNRIPTGRVLQRLQSTLDHLVPGLHLLKYTRAAVMRVPAMRDRAGAWWEGEKKEGDAVLADEGFKRTAKGMQLAYDEKDGVLRESTKAALNSLMPGMVPSEHWRREGT
ncbi:hypothetical protein CC1G_11330 [Coprinopsis cinerea okayama7|uniref:Uncharacterized protein n=1 Tax=Coprinopsis cinerea (strain Okayama-7 / 130 / ATCC MYA-4618 / FGSC 9003) TaxID=240176 RepID=A8P5R8_COPC7|nr:hypothetical protein CC1G_11330 [Coprinopsis cinerea okayama7\|eukprot:XP_001839007.1 hypothetical protein CC1G_11330 [Coprinopsis cinerea okayama7\